MYIHDSMSTEMSFIHYNRVITIVCTLLFAIILHLSTITPKVTIMFLNLMLYLDTNPQNS